MIIPIPMYFPIFRGGSGWAKASKLDNVVFEVFISSSSLLLLDMGYSILKYSLLKFTGSILENMPISGFLNNYLSTMDISIDLRLILLAISYAGIAYMFYQIYKILEDKLEGK